MSYPDKDITSAGRYLTFRLRDRLECQHFYWAAQNISRIREAKSFFFYKIYFYRSVVKIIVIHIAVDQDLHLIQMKTKDPDPD